MQKKIQVVIEGIVKGLREVREFSAVVQKLSGGGQTPAVAGVPTETTNEYRQFLAVIEQLAAKIEKLQPGKLEKLIAAGGNVGALLTGLSKYSQAVGQLQKVKEDAGNVIARVTTRAREFTSAVGEKATAGVSALSSRLPPLGGGLIAVGAGGAAAATGVGLAVVAVLALVAGVSTLAAVIPAVLSLLRSLFERGVDYNSNLEQQRLGIAAVIASLAELRREGQPLEGAEKLNAAYALAGQQLEKLKVDAVNTVATFEQIAPAFQAAIGPGLAAGLTLEQIRETTVKIVQAAGAVGVPMHQINQEVRAILEGTINEDARLAKVLGISNEMVKSWRAQGTLAGELNKRLGQFEQAGGRAADTLDGLKSNLLEAFNVFAGDATDGAFETLKQRMKQLLPQLFDFKNARLDQAFKPLSDLLDSLFTRAVEIAGSVIQLVVAGLRRVAQFVGENRLIIEAILQTAGEILQIVVSYASYLLGASSNTQQWQGVLGLVLGILQSVKLVLLSFAPAITSAATAARVLLALLLAAYPALNLLGAVAGGTPAGQGLHNFSTGAADSASAGIKLDEDGASVATKGREQQAERLRELIKDLSLQLAFFGQKSHEAAIKQRLLSEGVTDLNSGLAAQAIELARALDAQQRYADQQQRTIDEHLEFSHRLDSFISGVNQSISDIQNRGRTELEKFDLTLAALAERYGYTAEQVDEFRESLRLLDELLAQDKLKAAADELRAFEQAQKDAIAGEKTNYAEAHEALDKYITALQKFHGLERGDMAGLNRVLTEQEKILLNSVIHLTQMRGLLLDIKETAEQIDLTQLAPQIPVVNPPAPEGPRVVPDPDEEDAPEHWRTRWARAIEGVQTLFTNFTQDLRQGFGYAFKNILLGFVDMVQRMIVEALAAKLVEKLFGSLLGGGDDDEGGSAGGGLFGGLGGFFSKIFGGFFAAGGDVAATPGGRLIKVAEAGFDEVVLTTDPRYSARTSRLLGAFMRRTGIGPALENVGANLAASITTAGAVPALAAGGFISDLPAVSMPEGGVVQQYFAGPTFNVRDAQSFKASEQQIKRDTQRWAAEGASRARGRG